MGWGHGNCGGGGGRGTLAVAVVGRRLQSPEAQQQHCLFKRSLDGRCSTIRTTFRSLHGGKWRMTFSLGPLPKL